MRTLPAALITLLLTAAPAAAQIPTPTPTPPAPAQPAPAQPAPPPANAKLSISVKKPNGAFALAGDRLVVNGTLTPWVAGQKVIVRVYRGSKKVKVKTLAIRQAGDKGVFALGVTTASAARYRFTATHRKTPELGTLQAKARRVTVSRASLDNGSRGPVVKALQRALAAMKFVTPTHGVYDGGTARAVLAWRKTNGRARTTSADGDVLRSILARRGAFKVRRPDAGRHAEADLSRQVLALINGNKVERVYHTSSGAGGTPTVIGTYRVYSKTPGTNAKGMVHSVYFHRGYAVHGYASVPTFNASHGCLRVPIPNARSIFDWFRFGDRVVVYP